MRLILIYLLLLNNLFAFEVIREYDGLITFFGKVGSANLKIVSKENNYTMYFKAKPTDFISSLTGFKNIEYISKGKIAKNGRYIPDEFKEILRKRREMKEITFLFNHQQKYIFKKVHTIKQVSEINVANLFALKRKYRTVDTNESKKIDYVDSDYLTIIENAHFYKPGEIKYLDEKKTSSLKLTYAKGNLFRFETKAKDGGYSIEMLTDEYGLLNANTYKSFKFGKAYIKATKTTVKIN